MKEFLAEHWVAILAVILYAAERFSAISTEWVDRLRVILKALESGKAVEASPRSITKEIEILLPHDIAIDTILDRDIQPKNTPRVSKGRRFLNGLLKVLPVMSRIVKG